MARFAVTCIDILNILIGCYPYRTTQATTLIHHSTSLFEINLWDKILYQR
ncbi:hypothetical protein XBP1_1260006 [Xenorhabdus bovienii str. puntauvense]|uniref:Uncharacterized protein n=2 Tax=Xenorhabdus bovienii TaxID=40576 RepID=A0A0B6X9M7_XENBV|nr:hypothetical protein XBFFR1_1190006 [Xenorhabdus bovienii str. feltiae France]CDG94198.1 hypothetical protein XBFFL1_330006 [Xenorhabdus bovienii str. feltiae Florida]CDG95409.1 hypothetical protein XBP1_1260006 [Xenorhabdus bovienii str. puntauvense]CDM90245.1 protein of unknown function [Xenorhabdus bovienii]